MIYSMAGNPRATDTAMARKAWERFKDRYPKPALVAALICFQEPGAALAPVRAAALKQLETPLEDPDFLHSCFYALFNQDRDDGEPAGARESKDDPAYAADLKALRRLAVKLLSAPGNVTSLSLQVRLLYAPPGHADPPGRTRTTRRSWTSCLPAMPERPAGSPRGAFPRVPSPVAGRNSSLPPSRRIRWKACRTRRSSFRTASRRTLKNSAARSSQPASPPGKPQWRRKSRTPC